MNVGHRIRTIYVKELIDILRDRRTLIAMVVVPIVLYPLLMLGSIQALSVQTEQIEAEPVTVVTLNEAQRDLVRSLIRDDQKVVNALQERREASESSEEDADEMQPEDPDLWNVGFVEGGKVEALEQQIRSRAAQLGVVIETINAGDRLRQQHQVVLFYDPEGFRSSIAFRRFTDLVERRGKWITIKRLDRRGILLIVIEPLLVEPVEVSSPGSILGQILPLILVLMTITGAIYPAIDLTAGERERGTLETLMVCPVPVVDLVVGKFLVVTTVALMGAALNLASVSATVYFGGFESVVSGEGSEGFPLAVLPLILLSLIPFAVLMSAIMIAVCSYARTFKEAQNYVTPVILAVLIPGGIAAFPATRLDGVMLVMPVGNMVLLTRELLLGGALGASTVAWVLFSTTLYAVAAVAVATKVFGNEAVVFSDTASLKSAFSRRLMRPTERPTLTMAVLVVALLFPIWFYVQTQVQSGGEAVPSLRRTLELMPLFFLLLPVAVCCYYKVNVVRTFALARPQWRYIVGAVLLGLTAWVPARELAVAQQWVVPLPEGLEAADEVLQDALAQWSPWVVLLLLAIVPAVSEEALFRGFLLSGLKGAAGKWTALAVSACAFGVFHFFIFKFPVTALLGLVLAYVCWQSGSLWPAVLMHALHNASAVSMALWPRLSEALSISQDDPSGHLPTTVLLPGCFLFLGGLWLIACASHGRPASNSATRASAS